MRSNADNVTEYLTTVPPGRADVLARLRQLCRDELHGYEESMDYGMPSYRRPGDEIEVAFASQARYISIYILRTAVMDRFRDRLTTKNIGKGCIRYGNPDRIDFAVIAEMLAASREDDGPVC